MQIKWHPLPRETHPSGCGGRIKRVLCLILSWGIFFFGCSIPAITAQAKQTKATISYDDGIPDEYREYFDEIGAEFGLCPELLESISYHESRFIPDVKNKNCYGLMQVNVKVHAERMKKYGYTEADMLTAYPNIKVAADLLAEHFENYGDDDPIILLLYSGAGWDAVDRYKENGFITDYVDDVLTKSAEYERLHGK